VLAAGKGPRPLWLTVSGLPASESHGKNLNLNWKQDNNSHNKRSKYYE
jgi:hypothetical protein